MVNKKRNQQTKSHGAKPEPKKSNLLTHFIGGTTLAALLGYATYTGMNTEVVRPMPASSVPTKTAHPETPAAQPPCITQVETQITPKMVREIEQKAQEIFRELDIKPTDTGAEKANQIFKIFKWVVENSKYTDELMAKQDEYVEKYGNMLDGFIDEVHTLFFDGESVCVGDAAVLDYLLQKAGFNTAHLSFYSSNPAANVVGHAATLLTADNGKEYILDATYSRAILELTYSDISKLTKNNFIINKEIYFSDILPEMQENSHLLDSVLQFPSIEKRFGHILEKDTPAMER